MELPDDLIVTTDDGSKLFKGKDVKVSKDGATLHIDGTRLRQAETIRILLRNPTNGPTLKYTLYPLIQGTSIPAASAKTGTGVRANVTTDTPSSDNASWFADHPLYTFSIILVLTLAIGISLYLAWRSRSRRTSQRVPGVEANTPQTFAATASEYGSVQHRGRSGALEQPRAMTPGPAPQMQPQATVTSYANPVIELPRGLEQTIAALQAAINTLASEHDLTRQMTVGTNETLAELNKTLALLSQQQTSIDEKLADAGFRARTLQSTAENGVESTLRALLAVRLDGSSGYLNTDDRQQLITRVEQSLNDFFRSAVPSRDGLQEHARRCDCLNAEVRSFRDALSVRFPNVHEKLAPTLADAAQLREELAGLLAQTESRNLRLVFSVDFFAGSNRESLLDGMAESLKKEVVKLAAAPAYFDQRAGRVLTTAAAVVADFSDCYVDPQRSDPGLQERLGSIFNVAGVSPITPGQNEDFRPAEHSLVEMLPRTNRSGPPQTVAQVVARGFRYRDQVIRKAAVVLYQ